MTCAEATGAAVPGGGSATERRCSWGRRSVTVERMTIQRMEHVGIVVDDLAAATAFFVELGLKLQGEGPVEGGLVDRVVGLEGVRAEIAMVETPDGHGRLELTKFHAPVGPGRRPARAGEHPGHPPCRIRSRRHRRRRRQLASPRRGARWRDGALRRQLSALLAPIPWSARSAEGRWRSPGLSLRRSEFRRATCELRHRGTRRGRRSHASLVASRKRGAVEPGVEHRRLLPDRLRAWVASGRVCAKEPARRGPSPLA